MTKVLATIFLIIFIWWAFPHIQHGEWFAPTATAPYAWTNKYMNDENVNLLATPPEGYGMYHFDVWNTSGDTVATPGRSVTHDDFTLRY